MDLSIPSGNQVRLVFLSLSFTELKFRMPYSITENLLQICTLKRSNIKNWHGDACICMAYNQ